MFKVRLSPRAVASLNVGVVDWFTGSVDDDWFAGSVERRHDKLEIDVCT